MRELRVLLKRLRARLKSDFNESDHPRDEDGKFGSGGGGSEGKKPEGLDRDALPASPADAQQAAQAKAAKFLRVVKGLPVSISKYAAGKAMALYQKTEKKYGRAWALTILSVGVVTFPTPFTTGAVLATIGMAHVCTKLFGKAPAPVQAALTRLLLKAAAGRVDMGKAFARAREFVKELEAQLEDAEGLSDLGREQVRRIAEGLRRQGEGKAFDPNEPRDEAGKWTEGGGGGGSGGDNGGMADKKPKKKRRRLMTIEEARGKKLWEIPRRDYERLFDLHVDLKPGAADRIPEMMAGIQSGMVSGSDVISSLTWLDWAGARKPGAVGYLIPHDQVLPSMYLKPGAKPHSYAILTRENQTFHDAAIEAAIAAGEPVPPEVLADYPDLAEKR